jgi:hypothetical protein
MIDLGLRQSCVEGQLDLRAKWSEFQSHLKDNKLLSRSNGD